MEKIIMSFKEREQVKVFEQLKRKEISQEVAAKMLHVSVRWVREKLKRYIKSGISGLIHKNRGRPSRRAWKKEEKDFAINLFRTDFKDFGPTYGSEKLKELHQIIVSKETLRKILIQEGLWKAKVKKVKYRKWRERKPCFGMMIQLDGSPHDWFEGRAPKCTLLVFIDDATSKLVSLEFAESESFDAVMNATLKYFKHYGRPCSFYVDNGSVFSVNTNNPNKEKITQFERAMNELNVEIIHARSPQAKGRVERVNQTLQDRLVKEMRLANISTVKDANEYMQKTYIPLHNERFSEAAAQQGDAHRSVEGIDLHNVFCIKTRRVLQNDFTISYKNRRFQVLKQQNIYLRPKEKIMIHEHLNKSVSLWIRGTQLTFEELQFCTTKNKSPVDYVRQNREDDFDELQISYNIGKMSLSEFLSLKESRVKLARPATEAYSHE